MAQCTHCDGTGKCQDDFHSGATIFGDDNHPGIMEHAFGRCPSCGGDNTEDRPDCPHCEGKGDPDNWM